VFAGLRWGPERVLDMPLRGLGSLVASLDRLRCRDRYEDAWTLHVATQGTSKDMKKHVGQWLARIEVPGPKAPAESKQQNQMGEFLRKFGGGL